ERDELSEVAGGGVALVEQPLGQSRDLLRPFAQAGGWHDAPEAAARQEERRPCGIRGRGLAEVGCKRRHLRVRGRGAIERFVERGEALHRSSGGWRLVDGGWSRGSSDDSSSLPAIRASGAASAASLNSPISPSYCVRSVPVSSPRVSARYRASASDQPCVTRTRDAPVSAIVERSDGQSA